jgi:hypothetical protein
MSGWICTPRLYRRWGMRWIKPTRLHEKSCSNWLKSWQTSPNPGGSHPHSSSPTSNLPLARPCPQPRRLFPLDDTRRRRPRTSGRKFHLSVRRFRNFLLLVEKHETFDKKPQFSTTKGKKRLDSIRPLAGRAGGFSPARRKFQLPIEAAVPWVAARRRGRRQRERGGGRGAGGGLWGGGYGARRS